MNIQSISPSRFIGLTLVVVLLMGPQAIGSEDASLISDIVVRSDTNTVELRVDGSIEYGYFPLSEPYRLVFDFPGTTLNGYDGQVIDEEVEGSNIREIRLSQFSVDPPIARMVFYLVEPASAAVNFSPTDGLLTIRVDGEDLETSSSNQQGELTDLFSVQESVEVETVRVMSSEAASTATDNEPEIQVTPDIDSDVYIIDAAQADLTITCPGLEPSQVVAEILPFPDRLHVRMFTSGEISGERPRFEQLDRGNIWNDIAKQWASYIDRDGRGIVDLTVYLYPDMGFTQSVNASGNPMIALFELPPEVITEVAVAGYRESDEIIAEAETIEISEPEAVESPLETESENDAITEDEIVIVHAEETVEVIEEAHLGYEIPPLNNVVEDIEAGEVTLQASNRPQQDERRQDTLIQPTTNYFSSYQNSDEDIYLRVGDVKVIGVENLVRVTVGNPDIAIVNVISTNEILLTALAPGNTTLLTWETGRGHITRSVSVLDATEAREEEIQAVIGSDDISVRIIMSGGTDPEPGVILEGIVDTEEARARAHMIASLYAGDERVSNLIEVNDPRQVLVEVRVVEIDKRALDEHLSQFSAAARADNDDFTIGIITDILDPENPGGGLMDSRVRPGIVNGDVEDVVFDPIDIVLSELESNREANILSEPNLVALSGHSAHFRVGGEIPYTYLNENGINVVEFREFGISLDMTPIVDSRNNVMLTINPIVRTVDMALAISGIPGFRTREMNTDVQLRSGETLVIGGLLQSEITKVVSAVPILSEIPILGELFQSERFNEDETELVIFLTPWVLNSTEQAERIFGVEVEHPRLDPEE